MKFVFFRFRRTEKMDSVMKGLMGAMPPPPRICGLEPPLMVVLCYTEAMLNSGSDLCHYARMIRSCHMALHKCVFIDFLVNTVMYRTFSGQ